VLRRRCQAHRKPAHRGCRRCLRSPLYRRLCRSGTPRKVPIAMIVDADSGILPSCDEEPSVHTAALAWRGRPSKVVTMALRAQQPGVARPAGFGKRGQVTLTPPPESVSSPTSISYLKQMGVWVAAAAFLAFVGLGSGGSGLLGGLVGGLLGHHLANRAPATPGSAAQAARPAGGATTATVQRGGFGSTASSGSGWFSGG